MTSGARRAWGGFLMVLGWIAVTPLGAWADEGATYFEPYEICDYQYDYGHTTDAVAWETDQADEATASSDDQDPAGVAPHMIAYYDDPVPGTLGDETDQGVFLSTEELDAARVDEHAEPSVCHDFVYGDAYEDDGGQRDRSEQGGYERRFVKCLKAALPSLAEGVPAVTVLLVVQRAVVGGWWDILMLHQTRIFGCHAHACVDMPETSIDVSYPAAAGGGDALSPHRGCPRWCSTRLEPML